MRLLLLITALCFGPLVHAGDCAPVAVSEDDRRAAEAIDQRSQMLYAALAERGDARALLARAMLAGSGRRGECRDGQWTALPAGMPQWRATALARQASAAADADALVLMLLHGSARRYRFGSGEREALRERLVALDSRNLAVHMLAPAYASEDDAEFDRWLELAAQSTHFTVHYTGVASMLLELAGSVAAAPASMVAATVRSLPGSSADAESWDPAVVDLVLALGHVMAMPMPALQPLTRGCDPQRDGAWSQARAERCLALARTLALHSDIGSAERIGLRVWHWLVEGSADESVVIATRRRLAWQHEATLATVDLVGADAGQARVLLRCWRESRSETELERCRLQAAGVPSTPPDDWLPRNPAQLQARPQTTPPARVGS
jgi:hypothetical protein